MLVYFDCFSGISGDMTLGALIDLGVPVSWLEENLNRLGMGDIELAVTDVYRHGIRAKKVMVVFPANQPRRNFETISQALEQSGLPVDVIKRSLGIFKKIAQAESIIHGVPEEKVHFHEVGAVDAVADIVGTALGLHYLKITCCAASPVSLGTGFVKAAHGVLPVPAPATLAILKDVPVSGTQIPFELTTPTGAAIVAASAQSFGPMPPMKILAVGYGAGSRDLKERPNLLRITMGKSAENKTKDFIEDTISIIETSVDDMNPEMLGYVMEKLFEDGALDVCFVPIFMKKNRPGTQLQVLCREGNTDGMISRIFSETSSLGVRYRSTRRRLLQRESIEVETPLGRVRAKRASFENGDDRIMPEYESCRRIAREKGVPIQEVYSIVNAFTRREKLDNEQKPV